MALRSGLSVEWSAAGEVATNCVTGDMGVDGMIVRFVLSTVRPEWSWEEHLIPESERRPCLMR